MTLTGTHRSDESAVLALEVDDHGVACIKINRPTSMNALSPELVVRLASAWDRVREDECIRCAVVVGEGTRAFCAGADLKLLVPLMSGLRRPTDEWGEQVVANGALIDKALLKGFDVVKPVVAAVNGIAAGGGFELVQGTDLRVMSTHARFTLPEVTKGLFPNGGSTVNLPQQMPYVRAMAMLLLGDVCDADEAYRIGLVNRVEPSEQVLPSALALAQRLAKLSPTSVQAIRRSVRAVRGRSPDDGYRIEAALAEPVFRSDAASAALTYFGSQR